MPHYKRMFDDKEFLYAFDLDGKEITLEIATVSAGQIEGEKGRKSKKPVVSFVGAKKKLALNKTNGKTIAAMYGVETDEWIGRAVTLFPTTTEFGGETVECIRIRPQVPKAPPKRGKAGQPQPDLTQQIADKMAEGGATVPRADDDDSDSDSDGAAQ